MNNAFVAGLIGLIAGWIITIVACTMSTTPDTVLREVGIERIEYCHNVNSNWYEIVWKGGCK